MNEYFSIGECMAELSAPDRNDARNLRYGGDTLNTALYLARLLGAETVGYVTRLGGDPFSYKMAQAWRDEGLSTELVGHVPGRTVGLYAIDVDEQGERSFTYWRGESPARTLFAEPDPVLDYRLKAARLLYFSGITLAILSDEGRSRLLKLVAEARQQGCLVAFDPNYRPSLWQDVSEAQEWVLHAYGSCSVLLTSPEEEVSIFGDEVVDQRCQVETVMKNGSRATRLLSKGRWLNIAPSNVVKPVDTTGAGDSFNAGYLAARMQGAAPDEAVRSGQKLAAAVVLQPGAVIDRADMPDMM